MVCIVEEKRFIFLLTYLILALIGSSAISVGEAFCFDYSNHEDLGSSGYLYQTNHTIDWLVGSTIRKTNNYSNSPLRYRLLRLFAAFGTIVITIYLVRVNLKTIRIDNIPIIKNLILLKLRN